MANSSLTEIYSLHGALLLLYDSKNSVYFDFVNFVTIQSYGEAFWI